MKLFNGGFRLLHLVNINLNIHICVTSTKRGKNLTLWAVWYDREKTNRKSDRHKTKTIIDKIKTLDITTS